MGGQRLLLTGASGFIGGALARGLGEAHEVWVLSRRVPAGWFGPRALAVDLASDSATGPMRRFFEGRSFDAVLHLAARLPVDECLSAHLETNVLGTQRLLESLEAPPRRVAYFSTVDVYGSSLRKGEVSEDSPALPLSSYAVSKHAGERVAAAYCEKTGAKLAVFRLSQVYGPGDPTDKVIPHFCREVRAGRRPVVQGTGRELRQPLFIKDLVAAVASWLLNPSGGTLKIFLLAGSERVSVLELGALVLGAAGLTGPPEFAASRENGPATDYRLNNERTRHELGWQPSTSLEHGIRLTLDGAVA